MRWFKIMKVVVGVCLTVIVSLILFSVFIVWGIGNAKGQTEIANILVGSWVIDTDTLGKIQVVEVFNTDGTWVCDHADETLRKGRWQYVDNMKININETEVTVGNSSEAIHHERLITIINLEYNQIVCKEGDRQFVLKRIIPPVPTN
ncbi:MAG: hypothetical protein IJ159_05715 [Prevotella sp.]|nr:hypothetical protein [Prevotella sp.]